MREENPKLKMPHIREKAMEIETHNNTGHMHLPKTHDDYLGVQHAAKKHHPQNFAKE